MKKLLPVLFILFTFPVFSAPWYLAGDFQGWVNNSTLMYDDGTHGDVTAGDGIYSLTYTVNATGYHGYKITAGNWTETYPSDNAWFYTTTTDQSVLFTLNTNNLSDGWYPTTKIPNAAVLRPAAIVAVGDWQSQVGEAGNWINNSTKTLMHDDGADGDSISGDGIYTIHLSNLSAGTYMIKAVESGTWHAWGPDGTNENSGNYNFTTTYNNQNVYFYVNTVSGRIKLEFKNIYYVAGDFQSWNANSSILYDDGTHGDLVAGDKIYSKQETIATAGDHGWKITAGSFNMTWPLVDSWFTTSSPNQNVLFTINTNNYNDGWFPSSNIINVSDPKPASIVAVGDWQSQAGEAGNWINNSSLTVMHDDGLDGDFAANDGIYAYHIKTLTAGSYSIKAAKSGSWNAWGNNGRSQDAGNLSFTTTSNNQDVYFYLNTNTGRSTVLLNIALPVELSSFTASINKKHVLLNWTTVTEMNNYGFDIERSVKGSGNWTKIGFVNGAGNSSVQNNYSFADISNLSDKLLYRLKQIDIDGSSKYTNSVEVDTKIPDQFSLEQNYPNPFNPSTTINYELAKAGYVSVKVFDVLGNRIATLVDENKAAGRYSVEFKAGNLPSGIYFYELNADGVHLTKKFNLLK